MKWSQPEFLYALPLAWVAMAGLFYFGIKQRARRLKQFSGEGKWTEPGYSIKRQRWNRVLEFLLVSLLLIALARPMYFHKDDRSELQGAPYLIALDISRSMLATDMKPSRYGAATNALDHFFAESQADRIGLVTFSGVGYLNAPLTFDTVALRTILHYVDPNTSLDPGSSVAAALERAQKFFSSNALPERVLIVISDGEELDGKSIPLASRLHREQHLVVHTIGVGTAAGTRIVTTRSPGPGNIRPEVTTRLDETNLRRIANVTGGKYFYLGENGSGLRRLRDEVLRPLAEKAARNDWNNYRECFQLPLALAILMLILKLWLGADRFSRRRKLPSIMEARS